MLATLAPANVGVGRYCRAVTLSFAVDHTAMLAEFQSGEERFVWGLDKRDQTMFFLPEDTGNDYREHVRANVICPVPGCEAALTTVHSTVKRDHLRHDKGAGGHGLESLFHAQGCALIHSWLTNRYPRSTVIREQYISPAGERRADVLITGPTGKQIAFEVQYSPLTADHWRARHDSYRSQEITDVWLFGHTEKQLKLSGLGLLHASPALTAVAETGSPVFFINPSTEQIAVAVQMAERYSAQRDGWVLPADVPIFSSPSGSHLEVYPLDDYLIRGTTFTSDRVDALRRNTEGLPEHNRQQQLLAERIREQKKQAEERRALAAKAAMERKKTARIEAADQIRAALGIGSTWSVEHPAVKLIHDYFDGNTHHRIDVAEELPEAWQCMAYFHLIAGNEKERFDTKQVAELLRANRIRLQKGAYRTIARWLYELVEADVLFKEQKGEFPSFWPTYRGTWW